MKSVTMMHFLPFQVVLLLVCLLIDFCNSLGNPYTILDIPKSSTVTEIRKAYKQLAKEWHPDKNDDPEAENKFVEINEAYELLVDPVRKKRYDKHDNNDKNDRLHRGPDEYQPFEEQFNGSGFRFQYSNRDITLFHDLSVTTKAFDYKLVPKSYETPYLVLFYADWCFNCLQVEPVWRRILEELKPIGVGIATVDAGNDPILAKRVSVSALPSLILLIRGKPIFFKESLFSVQKIVEFVRNKMPYNLIQNLPEGGLADFLSGWTDNKVRALVFQRHEPVRLRYLLTAFSYRERVSFAFVQINTANGEAVRAKLQVPPDMDTLLLFNENTERPVASVSMGTIPVPTLRDVIRPNQYLILPRLTSQDLLDDLCPTSKLQKRLCVLLVSHDTPYHEPHRQSLRRFAQEANYENKVCFMYIFQERQVEFVQTLLSDASLEEPMLAVLWRHNERHIKYQWLLRDQDWANYNTTKEHLDMALKTLLSPTQVMPYEAEIKKLIDERQQGFVSNSMDWVTDTYYTFCQDLERKHLYLLISIVGSVAFIAAAGFLMKYLMKLEEDRLQEDIKKTKTGSTTLPASYKQTLKMHELRKETYNGLVRLLLPGCRTLLLVGDTRSLPVLLAKYHKAAWPYRKNKTLLFGYLNLDRSFSWYKEILTLSLLPKQPLKINPRNCIGTVLCLNGLRKYFCMYHAMHPESLGPSSTMRLKQMTRNMTSGSFLGFEDNDMEDDDLSDVEQGRRLTEEVSDKFSQVIFEDKLLDGLPNWLDRLFEGSTQRYYVNYWPEYTGK